MCKFGSVGVKFVNKQICFLRLNMLSCAHAQNKYRYRVPRVSPHTDKAYKNQNKQPWII